MQRKKLFLILLMLLFITGCNNVSYNLNINLNSNEEHLSFNYKDIDNMEELLHDNINNDPSFDQNNIYYKFNDYSADIFYTTNDIKNIAAINTLYNNIETTTDNNITNVTLTDYNNAYFVCSEYADDCSMVLDTITFNLTSEYKIISSNADEVDEKNNKHTWYFTKDVRPNLTFSYSDDIRWDIVIKHFISKNLTSIIIGIVLIISVITGIYFIYKTIKNKNK